VSEFITSIVIFCIFFIPLRLMRGAWLRGQLQAGFRWIAGIMAWGALVSAPGPLIVLILILAEIFSAPSMGSVFTIGSLLFLASLIGYLVLSHPELLDFSRMKEFWYRSLLFQNPAVRRDNVFHELEWHEIKTTHAEQTGKELLKEHFRNPEIPHTDPEQALREIEKVRSQPVQRADLEEELNRLKAGEAVDVTDALRINAFRTKWPPQYENIQTVLVDPESGSLKCRIVFPSLVPATIASADGQFRVLQEVYDILHSLQAELWIKHYEAYIATLFAECYRVETDSFALPVQVPFLRVHLPLKELRANTSTVHIVTDLTRLRRAEWVA
jgi:hypothetical protein